ncbi:MAG: GIY-YIG nuclease family protein [Candidatus Goldbacteria bacterium]|nr:GIY-YIG nuclease family protein [Candidatus Goldiibacteriota bacterium]
MRQKFSVNFDGYWPEAGKDSIPDKSGVYCIYSAGLENGKLQSLKKLIYIGESGDGEGRLKNHEKWPDWKSYLNEEQKIYISFAQVPSADRERIEAALIYKHKPPENIEHVDNFNFDDTDIELTGTVTLLTSSFSVKRTT